MSIDRIKEVMARRRAEGVDAKAKRRKRIDASIERCRRLREHLTDQGTRPMPDAYLLDSEIKPDPKLERDADQVFMQQYLRDKGFFKENRNLFV